VERKLFKVKFQAEPFEDSIIKEKKCEVMKTLELKEEDTGYFVFTDETSNTTYDPMDEHINILFKDGTVKDISNVDNALIQHNLSGAVRKYYICYWR
jgi:hypothetical protein